MHKNKIRKIFRSLDLNIIRAEERTGARELVGLMVKLRVRERG